VSAKRDYKAEYKKFQSSPKMIKYRTILKKYNRDKGTYGNGDGLDASHVNGQIVGFEPSSINNISALELYFKILLYNLSIW
jgi:hypothetical protein